MKVRYFDHAATTPVREEVIKEMIPYLGEQYVMHLQCILWEEMQEKL